MRAGDYARAVGWALAVLVANMLVATLAIVAVNAARAVPLAPEAVASWTAPPAGCLLFAAAMWLAARRRPQRPALMFALAAFAAYAGIDLATGYAAAGAATFQPLLFVSLALAGLGAVAGALLGRPMAP